MFHFKLGTATAPCALLLAGGLHYEPSVSAGEEAVKSATAAINAGMLNSSTDVAELPTNSFVHPDVVSDEWLRTLHPEKVPGGQAAFGQEFRVAAECAASWGNVNIASCCSAETK
jgi:hypothetical protein